MISSHFWQAPSERIQGSPMVDCYRATGQNRGVHVFCQYRRHIFEMIGKVLEDKVRYLCGLLACSKHTLVLTGAGASTSAGLLAPFSSVRSKVRGHGYNPPTSLFLFEQRLVTIK